MFIFTFLYIAVYWGHQQLKRCKKKNMLSKSFLIHQAMKQQKKIKSYLGGYNSNVEKIRIIVWWHHNWNITSLRPPPVELSCILEGLGWQPYRVAFTQPHATLLPKH